MSIISVFYALPFLFFFLSITGSDVEDSLYWIAYATQPSNIKPHPVDPSPLIVPENSDNKDGNGGNDAVFC